jgi:hypothetical protein
MDSTDVANLKEKWYCTECEVKQNKVSKKLFHINILYTNIQIRKRKIKVILEDYFIN